MGQILVWRESPGDSAKFCIHRQPEVVEDVCGGRLADGLDLDKLDRNALPHHARLRGVVRIRSIRQISVLFAYQATARWSFSFKASFKEERSGRARLPAESPRWW